MFTNRRCERSALDLGHWRLKYFQQDDTDVYLWGKRRGLHLRHYQSAIVLRFRRLAWASNENVWEQRSALDDVDWQQGRLESHASCEARSTDEVCHKPQDEALLLFGQDWWSSLRGFLSACGRPGGRLTHKASDRQYLEKSKSRNCEPRDGWRSAIAWSNYERVKRACQENCRL